MRFLRLTLGADVVNIGQGVDRIDVLNNQYLTDGTIIELSQIESDRDVGGLFAANPATISYEIIEGEAGQYYVYHHLRPDDSDFPHRLISLLDEHRLLLVYPVRIDATAGATLTLMGTTEMVQEAFARIPAAVRQQISIEQVTDRMPTLGSLRSRLTTRQREVLDAAIELEYYSVPRNATSDDIARAVGCAPSTASEHLRKIEARVMATLAA